MKLLRSVSRFAHIVYRKVPERCRFIPRLLLRLRWVRPLVLREVAGTSLDSEITSSMRAHSPIDLVVHVGAHLAEESWLYETLGAKTVLWIEADPLLYSRLVKKVQVRASSTPLHVAHLGLISDCDGVDMVLRRFSNDGASNSVYALSEDYAKTSPTLSETGETVEVLSQTLSSALREQGIYIKDYLNPLLVIDVQGHELAVLKGVSADLISTFNLVCVEVSMESVYEGGAKGGDVITWLTSNGFFPVTSIPDVHGDVLLLRRHETDSS